MAFTVGSASISLVPSFKGFADAIDAEAAKWGDESGNIFAESFKAAVGKLSFSIGVDDATAKAKLDELRLDADELGAKKVSIGVDVAGGGGIGGLSSGLETLGEDASGTAFSIADVLVPALGALAIAAIPLAGISLGGLIALPGILSGFGLGLGAIVLAAPYIEELAKVDFGPFVAALKPLIVDAILPGIQQFFTDILPVAQSLQPVFVGVAAGIGTFAGQLGSILGNKTSTKEFFTIFQSGAGFMKQLAGAALDLVQPLLRIASSKGAQDIISAIGTGIINLAQSFANWVDNGGFQKFVQWLKDNAPRVVQDVTNFGKEVGQLVVALTPLGVKIDDVIGFVGKLSTVIKDIYNVVRDLINIYLYPLRVLLNLIGDAVKYVSDNWRGAWTDIKSVLKDAWDFIKPILSDVKTIGLDVLKDAINDLKSAWDTAWGDVKHAVDEAWQFIQPIVAKITQAIDDVDSAISKLSGFLHGSGAALTNQVDQGFATALTGAITGTRAKGGPVMAGASYLVGEGGPEILRLGNMNGNITPNNLVPSYLAASGGSSGPVQHVDVQIINSQADAVAMAMQLTFLQNAGRL